MVAPRRKANGTSPGQQAVAAASGRVMSMSSAIVEKNSEPIRVSRDAESSQRSAGLPLAMGVARAGGGRAAAPPTPACVSAPLQGASYLHPVRVRYPERGVAGAARLPLATLTVIGSPGRR